jgi:hypothetical protein
MQNLAEDIYSRSSFYTSIDNEEKALIGINQWKAIKSIEEKYEQYPMTRFGGVNFSDDIWGTDRVGSYINWGKMMLPDNSNYPLILFFKILIYQRVQVLKYSSSDAAKGLGAVVRAWSALLGREHILCGKLNQPLVPSEVISSEKLHSLCVEMISIEKNVSQEYFRIWSWIASTSKKIFKELPFALFNIKVPWSKIKSTTGEISPLQKYINELIGSEATRISIRSYEAYSSETVAKIIDRAIPIFSEHSKSFTCIFSEFDKAYKESQKLDTAFYQLNLEHTAKLSNTLNENESAIALFPDLYAEYKDLKESIPNSYWFNNLHQRCLAASVWIILFTTGLRNIDIRLSLLRDCWVKDPDSDLIHYIITDIQKVRKEDYPIPAPPITIQAIEFLNAINFAPAEVNNLLARLFMKGKYWEINQSYMLNSILKSFTDCFDIDLLDEVNADSNQDGVCHRARVTLAQWIGTNSPLAVLIVKRLFAHTNEIMPDHYLKNNMEVKKERQNIQQATYINLAENMSEAIVKGKFSGGAKASYHEGVEMIRQKLQLENQSLVGEEMQTTLKEHIKNILIARIRNGEMLAMQTPLGFICLRNTKSTKPAPCAAKKEQIKMKESDIDVRFARALQASYLPNLDNCQGSDCQHSFLFDNPMAQLLLESFRFYCSYLKGVGQFSTNNLDAEAQHFIDLYYPPLLEVYPEIKSEMEAV